MKLTPIKDESDIFRDESSNAIVFKNTNNPSNRQSEVFRTALSDINNLKEEISDIKSSLSKLLEIVSKENS